MFCFGNGPEEVLKGERIRRRGRGEGEEEGEVGIERIRRRVG